MRKISGRSAFVFAFLAAAIGLGHGESHAITYTYAGTCTANCDATNATVSGSISFLDAALVPGSPYPAPTSFALHFGAVDITDATVGSFGLFAFPLPPFPGLPVPAIVPLDLTSFVAELHAGEDPLPPADGADGVIITPSGLWLSTGNGNCIDDVCTSLRTRGSFAEGTGGWSGPAATVPEPATLVLFATGLVGTVCMMRRRGRKRNTELAAFTTIPHKGS
jgi:hypothetical protein